MRARTKTDRCEVSRSPDCSARGSRPNRARTPVVARIAEDIDPVHAGDVARRRWNELDPRLRQAVLLGAGVEAGLKIAALIDLAQRPPAEVRGSKARWAVAITLVNSAGLVPIGYFLRGRRR